MSFADFSSGIWPGDAAARQSAFEGARFRDVANFKTENFSAYALFDGATFERRLLLSEPIAPETPKSRFKQAVTAVEQAVAEDERLQADTGYNQEKDPTHGERGGDARWGALAGGYRTVKLAMAAQGDFNREQTFYRFEVQSRIRRPSIEPWEKLTANAYGLFSDYGGSIARPFVSIAVSLVAFALLYWLSGLMFGDIAYDSLTKLDLGAAAGQSLDYSLTNIFRPLSALSAEPPEDWTEAGLADYLLYRHGVWWGLLFRVLAIIQSFMAVMMLFLFGLALRRRFQIG